MKKTFTEEDQTLIDFTKELISQYNESLSSELKHMNTKVNLNDSYERLVYYDNGKESKKYIDDVLKSMENEISESINKNNIKDINKYTILYIINVLKRVNIQSEIINDFVDYLYRQKNNQPGIYRRKYDLNIADNRDLYFTRDCLKIDYVKLSEPISSHIKSVDENQTDGFYMLLNDLKLISKELDTDYKEEYKVRSIGRKKNR